MPQFPDISEFYTGERAVAEEVAWQQRQLYLWNVGFIGKRLGPDIKSVVEFGCGTGNVAYWLPEDIDYLGVDKNPWFLERARERNDAGLRRFVEGDVRVIAPTLHAAPRDLATCWAFLKHFALDEFDQILEAILRCGRFGAFNVQLAEKDFDNGTEYHHSFVTREHLEQVVQAAGHKIIEAETQVLFQVEKLGSCQEVSFWTKCLTSPF